MLLKYYELYFIETESANQNRMTQQPRRCPLLENLFTDLDILYYKLIHSQ
ncbi:Uncharacterized protein FWK35_00030393 [Aphis craccivora]|uniref:Uncharacterized protein n=1 Tax=Aphis craccivora TaxID=307492 RepID=A0A6G0YAX2_APHCR|nr:Uncharacterized protein FWK35_00030393 [Aphis craccivora]